MAGMAFCEIQFIMKIDGILARNINFEVANFQVLRATRRKIDVEMLVLMPPRASSRVSAFPLTSPCLWGKPHLLLEGFQAGCHAVLRGKRGTS